MKRSFNRIPRFLFCLVWAAFWVDNPGLTRPQNAPLDLRQEGKLQKFLVPAGDSPKSPPGRKVARFNFQVVGEDAVPPAGPSRGRPGGRRLPVTGEFSVPAAESSPGLKGGRRLPVTGSSPRSSLAVSPRPQRAIPVAITERGSLSSPVGGTGADEVDLGFYTPEGWDDSVILHTGDHQDTSAFQTTDRVHLDLAWANYSETIDITETYYVRIYFDGDYSWWYYVTVESHDAWSYIAIEDDEGLQTFASGDHYMEVFLDDDNVVEESDEDNNYRRKDFTVTGEDLPDLAFYGLEGWDDSMVLHTGDHQDTDTFQETDTVFLDLGWVNNSDLDITAAYEVRIFIDQQYYSYYYVPIESHDAGIVYYGENWSLGSYAAGQHCVEVFLDIDNTVAESDEDNNYRRKDFTVTDGVDQPDLAFFQLEGWDDSVVLHNGDDQDRSVFQETDTVYLNFGWINDSSVDITTAHKVGIFIDKDYTWYYAVDMASHGAGEVYYVEDGSLGTFAEGDHYVEVFLDVWSDVEESDETNNYRLKEFQVGGEELPDLAFYGLEGWDDSVVLHTGDHVDTAAFQTTDTVYLDFGWVNDSSIDISTAYQVRVYIDGGFWGYSDLESHGAGVVFYFESLNLGTFAEGDHTVEIFLDYNDDIAEGDEDNNARRKDFSVSSSVSITCTEPASDQAVRQGNALPIAWEGDGPSGSAVELFYDGDTEWDNGNETMIATGQPVSGSFSWDTTGVAPGLYHVCALISDDGDSAYDYAEGEVRVVDVQYQPDLWIGTPSASSGKGASNSKGIGWIGDDVFNDDGTGQTRTATVGSGTYLRYAVRLFNDGLQPETFWIKGDPGHGNWMVRYYRGKSPHPDRDVTRQVLSENGWKRPQVPVGGSRSMVIEVYSAPGTTGKCEVLLQARSDRDPYQLDCVKAVTQVPRVPPDLWIKHRGTWLGDQIYNGSGDGQTSRKTKKAGAAALYLVRLYNDGDQTKKFLIKGSPGDADWTVRYYEGTEVRDDREVTAEVTGVNGWERSKVPPGGGCKLVVTVRPDSSLASGERYKVWIRGEAKPDPYQRDVVKAVTEVK